MNRTKATVSDKNISQIPSADKRRGKSPTKKLKKLKKGTATIETLLGPHHQQIQGDHSRWRKNVTTSLVRGRDCLLMQGDQKGGAGMNMHQLRD